MASSQQKEIPAGVVEGVGELEGDDLSSIAPFLEQLRITRRRPHANFAPAPWLPLPLPADGPHHSSFNTLPPHPNDHHSSASASVPASASATSAAPLQLPLPLPYPLLTSRHHNDSHNYNHRPASSHSAKTIRSRYSLASASTERTRLSSIWDTTTHNIPAGGSTQHPRPASSVGRWDAGTGDTPDRRELTDQELLVIQEQAAPPPSLLLSGTAVIPCEFSRYSGCAATFNAFTQVSAWIRHVREDHLAWDLPPACLCWFCDVFKFIAGDGGEAGAGGSSRLENFHSRMQHIAGHFKEEGGAPGAMRPDFHFLDHLWRKRLITAEVFEREKQRGEGVPVDGLRPRNHKTTRMVREEEQRTRVVHSSREEERQRRRAKANSQLKVKA